MNGVATTLLCFAVGYSFPTFAIHAARGNERAAFLWAFAAGLAVVALITLKAPA